MFNDLSFFDILRNYFELGKDVYGNLCGFQLKLALSYQLCKRLSHHFFHFWRITQVKLIVARHTTTKFMVIKFRF